MAAPNLFDELKDALTNFKTFLHDNLTIIKPVIIALQPLVPKITELIDQLIDLLGKLSVEIDKLDTSSVTDKLDTAAKFTNAVKVLLETAKPLLSDADKPAVDQALEVVSIVNSLPSIQGVKDALKGLIDDIVTDLKLLKA